MKAEQLKELYEILNALREGVITDANFERLDSWISNDERACRLYVDYVKLWADLQGFQVAVKPDYDLISTDIGKLDEENIADSQFWKMLAEHEKSAEAIELPNEQPQHELIQKVVYPPKEKRKISKFTIFTFTASAAAMLAILVYVNYYPIHKDVATLTKSAHARWADTNRPMEIGTRLCEREPLFLKQGVVKIIFDSGAEIVVEAPALIKLQSDEKIELNLGRLYAYVPKQSVGFTVNTPRAGFIDLGTEFGVDVDISDKVRTEVYKGKVAMQSGSDSTGLKQFMIGIGQAGLVDQNGQLSITEFSTQQRGFVRSVQEFQLGSSLLNRNLIVNGDFEKDKVTYDPQKPDSQKLSENNISIFGWNDSAPATINTYETLGGSEMSLSMRLKVPVPPDKGRNFFMGYKACTITQKVSVADLSYKINRGKIAYVLSGWIGGWETHEDNLEITASFLDYSGQVIDSAHIGPVTAEERNYQTCFVEQSEKGILPPGVQEIMITLKTTYMDGGTADAYADNLKFVLSSDD